ncbi:MAG TPA: hypothetical protein VFR07_00550 [Mycobacteriales bacterium]|jgi:hypothetical protein|nr:hypothetical protein [Mycobacteriales bacterium]
MLHTAARTRALFATTLSAGLLAVGTATPVLAADAGAGSGGTLFGSCVQMLPGETWPEAVDRVDDTYNGLDAVRLFSGAPADWTPAKFASALGGREAVISFKIEPAEVLSGMYDDDFRTFFNNAPTNRPTWWSYLHEPDVAFAQGRLTDLAQYRAAFTRVALLARQARNPALKTTLVLFGYSGNERSGQDITDYWPGDALTDVIAWDIYNGWATRQGFYGEMGQIEHDRDAARAVGKPWAIAEFGSVLLPGDDGSGRAAWLREITRYAKDNGALFATYFDSNGGPNGTDYRLTDAPSRNAWRDIVAS